MSNFITRISVLEEIFPDFIHNSQKEEFITWCSLGCNGQHHKQKLQINYNKNIYNCWVCGSSGFIIKLLNASATKEQKQRYIDTIENLSFDEEQHGTQILSLPEGSQFLLDALSIPEAQASYKWLVGQTGISDEQIFQQKIQFVLGGNYNKRLIFPSYSEEGNLNFFVTRDIFKLGSFKYLNCEGVPTKNIIFNEILIDWEKPIIIVEGVKSYLKHLTIDNIVPIFGTRLTENYLLFKKIIFNGLPCVYLALDYEARDKSHSIMNNFNFYGIESRFVDLSDVNQPDEIDTLSFLNKIQKSTEFSKMNLLISKIQVMKESL